MNILPIVVGSITNELTNGQLSKLEDCLLDQVEKFVKRTDNTIDDTIVLPVIKGMRHILGTPKPQDEPKIKHIGTENE